MARVSSFSLPGMRRTKARAKPCLLANTKGKSGLDLRWLKAGGQSRRGGEKEDIKCISYICKREISGLPWAVLLLFSPLIFKIGFSFGFARKLCILAFSGPVSQ